MTTNELLAAVYVANGANVPKVALYHPAVTKAARLKKGGTRLTLELIVTEFTPDDVMNGLWMALALVARPQYESFVRSQQWLATEAEASSRKPFTAPPVANTKGSNNV